MPCRTIPLPGGGYATVRTANTPRRRCQAPGCTWWGEVLCDFPAPERKSKTCDARACRKHARHVGPDRDHCWQHETEAT